MVTKKKTEAPSITAVKKKYGGNSGAYGMRVKAARGKGEAGKASLIAWKRSSGYQADINAARKSDAAKVTNDPATAKDIAEKVKPDETVKQPEAPKEATMAERIAVVNKAGAAGAAGNYGRSNAEPKATPSGGNRAGGGGSSKSKVSEVRKQGKANQKKPGRAFWSTPQGGLTPKPKTAASKPAPKPVTSRAPKTQPVTPVERRKTAPRTTRATVNPAVRRIFSPYGKG